jgi:hypothetical protein
LAWRPLAPGLREAGPKEVLQAQQITHVATEMRSQDVDEAMNKEQEGIHERNKPFEMS